MLVSRLLTRPCTITSRSSAGAADDYGNVEPAETTAVTVCELQQQRRSEPDGQGELSDTIWLLVLPPGTAIDTGDAVTVDGDEYEMVGDPWPVRHPRTGTHTHVECTVRRTG